MGFPPENNPAEQQPSLSNSILSSVQGYDSSEFSVAIPDVKQIAQEAENAAPANTTSAVSSWFGGYVPSLPAAFTGSSSTTYTAYHIVTCFNDVHDQSFEVDRRFS